MAEQLKNMYNEAFVDRLATELEKAAHGFDPSAFRNSIFDHDWEKRELKDRSHHITKTIHSFLPYDYSKQIDILTKIAPEFNGYAATIFPAFVELYGLEEVDISLSALEVFTKYSTSEFAIRPFLIQDPNTINQLYTWSKHENYHVRRLASEGCRPLLPWGMKLHDYVQDPSPIIPILENLRNDPKDYVYRSVANNLNDISKNHPDLALSLAEQWIGESKTTRWVCKHGLRTLLKSGDQRAMKLFGFGDIQSIKVDEFAISSNQIKIGDSATLKIGLKNTGETAQFRLEYAVGYLKKNGAHHEKTFQLKETELTSEAELSFQKKMSFKDLTTRKHYPGEHYAYLKVNGNKVNEIWFSLH